MAAGAGVYAYVGNKDEGDGTTSLRLNWGEVRFGGWGAFTDDEVAYFDQHFWLVPAGTEARRDDLPTIRTEWYDRLAPEVTDDGKVQRAIDDATDQGKVLTHAEELLLTGVNAKTNLHWIGTGRVKCSPDAGLYLIHVPVGVDDVTLEYFEVDGNKANIPGDPDANGNPMCLIMVEGTSVDPAERIFIRNLFMHDAKRVNIAFQNVQTYAATGNTVINGDRDGIASYFNCRDGFVDGNTIGNMGDDLTAVNAGEGAVVGFPERISISNNKLYGPGRAGRGTGAHVRGGDKISVHDNQMDACSQGGVVLETWPGVPLSNSSVDGNQISRAGNGNATVNDRLGVKVAPGTHDGITNTAIVNNRIKGALDAGIGIQNFQAVPADTDVNGVIIALNGVEGCGNGGIASLQAGASDVMITMNRTFNNLGDGIGCANGKRIHVRQNMSYRNTVYGVNLASIAGGSCEGNQCYDDRTVGATQQVGLRLNSLSGTWSVKNNPCWGNTTLQKSLNAGTHTATFDGGLDIDASTLLTPDMLPWTIDIDPFSPSVSIIGAWAFFVSNTYAYGGVKHNGAGAVNDEINWDLVLAPGVYRLTIYHDKGPDRGIMTVQVDGATVGIQDAYAAAAANNQQDTLADFTLATAAGKRRLKIKMLTKNAASTGFAIGLQRISLKRVS